jgi:hypothetical protein
MLANYRHAEPLKRRMRRNPVPGSEPIRQSKASGPPVEALDDEHHQHIARAGGVSHHGAAARQPSGERPTTSGAHGVAGALFSKPSRLLHVGFERSRCSTIRCVHDRAASGEHRLAPRSQSTADVRASGSQTGRPPRCAFARVLVRSAVPAVRARPPEVRSLGGDRPAIGRSSSR